jgi:hypothetical protein
LFSLCCCILALPLITRYGLKLTFLFGTASAAAAALFLGLLCQLSQLHDSWAGKLSAAIYIGAQVTKKIQFVNVACSELGKKLAPVFVGLGPDF